MEWYARVFNIGEQRVQTPSNWIYASLESDFNSDYFNKMYNSTPKDVHWYRFPYNVDFIFTAELRENYVKLRYHLSGNAVFGIFRVASR